MKFLWPIFSLAICMGSVATARQPNILLIVADDMGYGDFGANVGDATATPEMNRIAGQGIRFTEFYANGCVCSPTRAALLTGSYQQRTGIEEVIKAAGDRKAGVDPQRFDSFAKLLREQGYATALFGKWHVGYQTKFNPIHHGFDEFRGFISGNVDYVSHIDQAGHLDWWQQDQIANEPGYTTHLIRDHGNRFIRAHTDQPFLLVLAHEAPHYPYQRATDPAFRREGKAKVRQKLKPQEQQARMRAMLETLDQSIASHIQTLDELGLTENTLVLFVSDNGPAAPGSAGPLRGKKGSMFEGGIRVPAFAYWKGTIQPGQVIDTPSMTIDLFPTFLQAAGVADRPRQPLDGVNLLPLLTGAVDALPERALFWSDSDYDVIRQGDWKWIQHAKGTELFNLRTDPGEAKNLLSEHPEKAAALSKQFKHWKEQL